MKPLPTEVRDALARCWNLEPTKLRFLGGGQDWSDGTVFTANGVVLKILDFPLSDQGALDRARERIQLVRGLGERGGRIVTPIPDDEGQLFQIRRTDRQFLAYAYRHVPGRPVKKTDASVTSGSYFRVLGAELGRLHVAGETGTREILPDGTCPLYQTLKGWRDEMDFFEQWCQVDEVRTAWNHVRQGLEPLPIAPSTYGFVHNDAHVANFLVAPGVGDEPELTIIDFDVSNFHWYLNDCAVALYSFGILGANGIETEAGPPAPFVARATEQFWNGYRRHRDPGSIDLDRLDLFLQYRRCLLFMPFQEHTAQNLSWRNRWVNRIVENDRILFG